MCFGLGSAQNAGIACWRIFQFSLIPGIGKAPDAVEGCPIDYKVWAGPRRAVEALDLPGSFYLEGDQPFSFGLDQGMLDDCVDSAAARALFQRVAQFG